MGRRSIPYKKSTKKLSEQQKKFGNKKPPSHPDPEVFQPGNLEKSLEWMAHWKIEPYWGHHPGTGTTSLMFRSIPGSRGLFHIKHTVDDIALYRRGLGLTIEDEEELHERVAVVQEIIRRKANLEHALFATRYPRNKAANKASRQ